MACVAAFCATMYILDSYDTAYLGSLEPMNAAGAAAAAREAERPAGGRAGVWGGADAPTRWPRCYGRMSHVLAVLFADG